MADGKTKKTVDCGDDFDVQTGEDKEIHNPDEYFVSKSTHRNRKKDISRKIKNAVVIACIAVVCILIVFAFALTQCSMTKIELSTTTAPTIPTLNYIANSQQEEETQVQTDTVIEKQTESEIQETTELPDPEVEEYGQDLDY